ncbi:MAG: hypothetical protein MK212_17750 [Saprospiraceae bacterium]|nr:hypothetical protein [Saprospiraceae bacterium]
MPYLKHLMNFCLVLLASNIFAQKSFTDGIIKYNLKVESNQSMLAMMDNSELSASFNGDMSQYNALVMGGMISANFAVDDGDNKGIGLMNLMGEQKAVDFKNKNYEKVRDRVEMLLNASQITHSSKTQKILGYTCRKVVLLDAYGNTSTMYVCDKIRPKGNELIEQMYGKLKGFPLQIETSDGQTKMIITAKDISHQAPNKSDFKFGIPKEYEKVSLREILSLFGGS